MNDERELSIYADGVQVCDGCRIRVRGRATMSCLPDPWQVDIISPDDTDIARIRKADKVEVCGVRKSVLCVGKPVDIISSTIRAQEAVILFFMDGEAFWKSYVAFSASAGMTVEQIVRGITGRCTNPVSLTYIPSSDASFPRGQVFCGRAASALDEIVRSFGWRAYTYRDSVYVVGANDGLRETTIMEPDLLDIPHPMDGGVGLKTDVVSMMPGQIVNVRADGIEGRYRLINQTIDADNMGGDWTCLLTLSDEINKPSGWEGI